MKSHGSGADRRRAYEAARYSQNRERRDAATAASRAKLRAIVSDAKAGGCVDCGFKDIRALDFDHVRGEKAFGISDICGRERLIAEIAKCEVRCANCHRIATAERRRARRDTAA